MFNSTNPGAYPVSSSCLAVLQLSYIKGLGLKSFHQLYEYFATAEEILLSPYEELIKSGIKPKLARSISEQKMSVDQVVGPYFDRLLKWADKQNNYLVSLEDELYPSSLKEIYCPPPLLYFQGHASAFEIDSIAVVGSRRPTLAGQKHAASFSRQLAEMGYCITSGLAIGVDSHAHRGAVDIQGVSCAVLGSGLESIYPKQNQKLALEIQEKGVLVSELALDTRALPANFPRRNRIISGLSEGTLVIEAGLNSGSLITAEFALEQNREVFVIPGSIDNHLSKGGHSLIKQGAALVDDVEDIVNVVGSKQNTHYTSSKTITTKPSDYSHLTMTEQKIISVLGHQSTSFDDLLHCLAMDVGELNNLLVMLELKGALSSVAGGYQRI
tara:strand:+ start:2567 stop:3718 length:1152 start_codon:yes stop_codon:yes gene_type:complete